MKRLEGPLLTIKEPRDQQVLEQDPRQSQRQLEFRVDGAGQAITGRALDVVQAAYGGDTRITGMMLRAAIAALPFENPKYAVMDHANGRKQPHFGDKLEATRKRSGKDPGALRDRIREELMQELGIAERQRGAITVPSAVAHVAPPVAAAKRALPVAVPRALRRI